MKPTPESMAKKAIHMIMSEYKTFDEICKVLQRSELTIRKYLELHYKKSGGKNSNSYKRVCRAAVENKRMKKAVAKMGEIHIVETGYILSVGLNGVKKLLTEVKEVVLPAFCAEELRSINKDVAQEFLKAGYPNAKEVIAVFPKKEILYEEPLPSQADIFSTRMVGIVALAVDFELMGYDVVIHTNSARIEALAKLQCRDAIRVERL